MNSAGRSNVSSIFQHGLQDGYLSLNPHVKGGLFPLTGANTPPPPAHCVGAPAQRRLTLLAQFLCLWQDNMLYCAGACADAIQIRPHRLKMIILYSEKFHKTKFQVHKNGDSGHFSDPGWTSGHGKGRRTLHLQTLAAGLAGVPLPVHNEGIHQQGGGGAPCTLWDRYHPKEP